MTDSRYIHPLETERIPCAVIFTNGFQMHDAVIMEHDGISLKVKHNGREQIVFIHAISTIVPSRPWDMRGGGSGD